MKAEVRVVIALVVSVTIYWLVEKKILALHLTWSRAGLLELNVAAVALLIAGIIFSEVNAAAQGWTSQSGAHSRIGLGEVIAILLTIFSSLAFLVVLFWLASELNVSLPPK